MARKIWVTESKRKNSDGEILRTITTHESKPNKFKYIIWK